jgi:hypothetical protein
MTNGKKKVSRFKTVRQKVFYLPIQLADKFEAYAEKTNTTQSKLVCEGIVMRMGTEIDQYNAGFNQGLNEAISIVKTVKGAKMMFPSGKSFGDLVCDEIELHIRRENETV